ncbi:MAG TPA: flagellar hook protein FlgE [Longimicrobiales bacterium]|nr:flagellar hook protein FlgE [Longimicrobiales bacterium]
MMRSLFAGVSGLRNHLVRMDVIGNNIANVNTIAFKSSRVTFKEAFAQLVQGASRPAGAAQQVSGGTNPIQVGLGMNIGSIDMLFTQGNLENTGITTDLAIQGDSFFVVSDGTRRYYTRSGNFQLDANGRLVTSTNGYVVQGRMAVDGVLVDEITDIRLPFGQKSTARATTQVMIGGNLDAEAADGTTRETTITVYDSMGASHQLRVVFTRTGGDWNYAVYMNDDSTALNSGTLQFASNGRLSSPESVAIQFTPANGAEVMNFNLVFGSAESINGLTQFAGASTAVLREQDGYTMGDLERISIERDGRIVGSFTNGVTLELAQIALADFNNPSGLIRTGDNMYQVSANSGPAVIGFAGEGSQSTIISGALEMSNVDLAQEFTSMIIAQRGFQSNARVITTSDDMLQELVNMKR